MSDPEIREAVKSALEKGGMPLRTAELIQLLQKFIGDNDPTGDAIKAAIWDLAEAREVGWDPEGRIALLTEAARV